MILVGLQGRVDNKPIEPDDIQILQSDWLLRKPVHKVCRHNLAVTVPSRYQCRELRVSVKST